MHRLPFYSRQLTSESPVNTRAKAASQERLPREVSRTMCSTLGHPWPLHGANRMTCSSDMSLESHQEYPRASQTVWDASVWVNESSPKTQVLSAANKSVLTLKWLPYITSSLKYWLLLSFLLGCRWELGACLTTAMELGLVSDMLGFIFWLIVNQQRGSQQLSFWVTAELFSQPLCIFRGATRLTLGKLLSW